ncbi:uncharacterized protein LOC127245342 [Andrographis paniculata]|uniref:uncharacterized protein LOC127245342 n=1 Tax=Andrographis paniculata TaxID=175694 RepID=UPI0021E9471A|nr:uncharacterized protein LOC127245342 [Andrographis paniculata]
MDMSFDWRVTADNLAVAMIPMGDSPVEFCSCSSVPTVDPFRPPVSDPNTNGQSLGHYDVNVLNDFPARTTSMLYGSSVAGMIPQSTSQFTADFGEDFGEVVNLFSVLDPIDSRVFGVIPSKQQMNMTEGLVGNSNKRKRGDRADRVDVKEIKPKGYIHVRARRGQATNSHSLAERVRREKISERMKFLQDLVPSCSKVTGKALMLDEIINYVQSLQRQVEFLSMKLATVEPCLNFNVEEFPAKDPRAALSRSPGFITAPCPPLVQTGPVEALQRQINGCRGFNESTTQLPSEWGDELRNIAGMTAPRSSRDSSSTLNMFLPESIQAGLSSYQTPANAET